MLAARLFPSSDFRWWVMHEEGGGIWQKLHTIVTCLMQAVPGAGQEDAH